jgi:hypothetical protein
MPLFAAGRAVIASAKPIILAQAAATLPKLQNLTLVLCPDGILATYNCETRSLALSMSDNDDL